MIATVAFLLPGGQEWFIILVAGLMLFGRRLPEVGRSVGRTIVQLRQGWHKLKDEIDLDGDVRDVRDTLRETRQKLTQSVEVPRLLADPGKMLQDLTDETLSSPGPTPTQSSEEVPDSLFE